MAAQGTRARAATLGLGVLGLLLVGLAIASAILARSAPAGDSARGLGFAGELGAGARAFTDAAVRAAAEANAATVRNALQTALGAENPSEAELEEALWVDGHIELPAGVPMDEHSVVVARGLRFRGSRFYRALPDASGHFRAAFKRGSLRGSFELEARYLYLDAPVSFLISRQRGSVELAPRLGGCIEGSVLPLGSMAALPTDPAAARVLWRASDGRAQRSAPIRAGLQFTLCGLPPGSRGLLSLGWSSLVPRELALVAPPPGRSLRVDLPADAGLSLWGNVVDEARAPLAGASVRARATLLGESGPIALEREAATDARGGYLLEGLPPGPVELRVAVRDHVPQREVIRIEPASTQHAQSFALRRGASIAGRVLDAEGAPQAGVRVEALRLDEAAERRVERRGEGAVCETDAEGRFSIGGLLEARYLLQASLQRSELVESASAPGEVAPKPRKRTQLLTATAERVAAGARELELALGAGLALEIAVLDEAGQPIESGTARLESELLDLERVERIRDGRARWTELQPGSWKLSLADGPFVASSNIALELPGDCAGRALRVERAAIVTGRVLDDLDRPLAGTRVGWRAPGAHGSSIVLSEVARDGRFRIAGIADARGELVARAPSGQEVRLALELAPGRRSAEQLLRFELGRASIQGQLDARIASRAERAVELRVQRHGGALASARTDANGNFAFTELRAGSYWLALPPEDAALARLRGDAQLAQSLTRFARVELAEDEREWILLGTPPDLAHVVSGTLRQGGELLAGVRIDALRASESAQESLDEPVRAALTDAAGRFRLELDRAGTYSLQLEADGLASPRFAPFEVRAQGETTLALELPDTLLAGRVLDETGQPLRGAALWVAAADSSLGASLGRATSDALGRFALRGCAPGSYRVQALLAGFEPAELAALVLSPGERHTDLVLRLRAAR